MATVKESAPGNITVTYGPKITIKTLNRVREDIGTWQAALKAYEKVDNPKRVQLYTLYENVLLDSHLFTVWQKRKLAILNRRIVFKKDGKEVEGTGDIIRKPWFIKMVSFSMDSLAWGHSLMEFAMSSEGIADTLLIERRNVSPERGMILLKETDTTGLPYREDPYVLEVGESRGFGLFAMAAPWVLYKRGDIGDWAQFNEVFGMPFRKYMYEGNDEATRILLEEAAQRAGAAGWAVLPKGSNLEFLSSPSGSSNKDSFLGLAEFCNKELSKLFLANTMTTEDGSSYSQSEVHAESEDVIREADKLWIQSILTEKARQVLVNLGYSIFNDGEFEIEEPMSLTKILEWIKGLTQSGYVVDPVWIQSTFGIPIIALKEAGIPLGKPAGAAR